VGKESECQALAAADPLDALLGLVGDLGHGVAGEVSILAVVVWVALVVLGGALATDTAATRASRITVREALTYL
jgi:hypothetical protein